MLSFHDPLAFKGNLINVRNHIKQIRKRCEERQNNTDKEKEGKREVKIKK